MAVNFLEAQAQNRRRTIFLVVLLTLILVAVALAFDARMTGELPLYGSLAEFAARPPVWGLGAFGLSVGYAGFTYFAGSRTILFLSRARRADRNVLEERRLDNVVEEMAIAAGLPKPELWILPDTDLNAFATGRSPETAAIAVTEGLLEKLSRDELQAVIAHEMGHIRNRDILLMLYVTCMLGATLLLVEMILRSGGRRNRLSSGSSKKNAGVVMLFVIVVAIVAWIVSRIVAMAVSREREYLADATSAEFTRNPQALADALRKIHAAVEPTQIAHTATAALFIDDPKGTKLNNGESKLAGLFATHPPIELRIRRMEAMAFAQVKRERLARGLDPLSGEAR